MSGKKKSDVTSVLKNADEVRKEIFEKQFREFSRRKDEFYDYVKHIKQKSLTPSVNISSEVEKEKSLIQKLENTSEQIRQLNIKMSQTADDNAISRGEWLKRALDDQYNQARVLIEDYNAIMEDINELNKSLSSKNDSIKKQFFEEKHKELALSKIAAIQDQISSITYTNPVAKTKMNLEEASKYHIGNTEVYLEVTSALQTLIVQVKKGNTTIEPELDKITSQLGELEKKLDEKTIDALEAIQTAIAIQNALEDLGYNYSTTLNGNSIHDGVSIMTKEPAELVFSLKNVIVHQSDGSEDEVLKVEFNIDNAPGSCGLTAGNLAKKLRSSGIDFHITDWGTATDPTAVRTQSQLSTKKSEPSNG